MSDLTEPLVGTPALDSDVLEQIRSVLTNAGITVETLGLPIGGAPDTSIVSEPLIHDDAGVEQEKTSSSWVKNQLTKRARRNRQSFTSEYPIAEGKFCRMNVFESEPSSTRILSSLSRRLNHHITLS